jgi:hypothetical protein
MLHTRWSETNEHIQPSEKLHCLLPCRSMPVSLDDSPPTFSEQSSDLIGLTGTGVGPEPLQWSYLSKQYHLNCVERGIHQVDLYAEQKPLSRGERIYGRGPFWKRSTSQP